jgi:excisionase family DNA binding protein
MVTTQEILTSREVMTFLRISKPTLYRMIRDGNLKAIRIGKNYRFLKGDIEDMLRLRAR